MVTKFTDFWRIKATDYYVHDCVLVFDPAALAFH